MSHSGPTRWIYHIARRSEWLAAQKPQLYEVSTLDKSYTQEGFVHCSELRQVLQVANAVYARESDLVLLVIDTSRLAAPVAYENLEGGAERYPHVYGPVNVDAVVRAVPFDERDERGEFRLPTSLQE
jgi:uncharacterized protein (DUF952 family)